MQPKQCPTITVYLLDTIQKGSPQHQAFTKQKHIQSRMFPTIVATKCDEDKEQEVQLLALQCLMAYSNEEKYKDKEKGKEKGKVKERSVREKVRIVFQLFLGVWDIGKMGYFVGFGEIQAIMFMDTAGSLKLKPYLATPISQFNIQNPTKDKETAKKAIQFCFDFPKSAPAYDIWKWAVFTSQLLYDFSLENYTEKVLKTEKVEEFKPELAIKAKFVGSDQLMSVLVGCLSPEPKKRPNFQQVAVVFHQILLHLETPLSTYILEKTRRAVQSTQSSIKTEYQIQLKQPPLGSDIIKKLSQTFIRNNLAAPKKCKALYRATRCQFNCRVFYEQCSEKAQLLFVIQMETDDMLYFYLEPVLTLDANTGFIGNYIADTSAKSFIYSSKTKETYKLANKDKAFRAIQGKGPIIGDGDIVLGGGPHDNWSYFPKSFLPGKHKSLTPKPQFSIKNYDVHLLTF